MEEILACRACLATDTKLYNMFKNELVSSYEYLTGLQISRSSQPQQICSYCAAMMLKCVAFQQKCRNAQQLLDYAIVDQHEITLDYIQSIDRSRYNLSLPYTTTYNATLIKQEHQNLTDEPIVDSIKYNTNAIQYNTDSVLTSIFDNCDVKIEENSDEEPLAKFIKKSKKRKRKQAAQDKQKNTEPEQAKNKINIKEELEVNVPLPFDDCFNDDANNDDDEIDDAKPKLVCDDQIEVVVLSKEDQIKELQARKSTLNYINSFYKCEYCYKGFMVEDTYKNHMVRHDPSSGSYSCDICSLRFPSGRTLQQHHLATHSHNYICKRCGHVSKAKSRAKEHYKWHQGVLYVCSICGAVFNKPTSHLTHLRTHHPSQHICHCGLSFVSAHGLNMHARRAHVRDEQSQAPRDDSKCMLCGVQFSNAGALGKHRELANGQMCDNNLRPCVLCGENFTDEDQLRKHTLGHNNEKTYECLECNKTFATARYQAAHYRRVHGRLKPSRGKPPSNAVCEICGKKCTSRATLVYHQRTHSGEKPYQCKECPKRFSILQRLQIHTRTHTGERPCACPHCPKAFKHKAALNRHLRVHTGDKPYSCTHCGKSFTQSNTMKGHVRTVHLKLPALYRHNNHATPQGV